MKGVQSNKKFWFQPAFLFRKEIYRADGQALLENTYL
jgi:hypothetical protein